MIPELESVSSLKEKQRTALKGFLYGKHVFALLPTGFRKEFDLPNSSTGGALPLCHMVF